MPRFFALLTPVFLAAFLYGAYLAYENAPELIGKAESSWTWLEHKVDGTPVEPALPGDQHATFMRPKTQQLRLHKTLVVNNSATMEFEVPPHVAIPRFSGTYQSFNKEGGERPGSVDFLLLSEDQYQEYRHGGAGAALDSADQSSSHQSSVVLSPSFDAPQKYYIVFRNSAESAAKLVKADFTASFSE
ncbi:MAG TPA: hypothetical protein VFA89_17180 [Terriglobales bacterium]|nr:hypothetical protein [Terriglobales bacterium]